MDNNSPSVMFATDQDGYIGVLYQKQTMLGKALRKRHDYDMTDIHFEKSHEVFIPCEAMWSAPQVGTKTRLAPVGRDEALTKWGPSEQPYEYQSEALTADGNTTPCVPCVYKCKLGLAFQEATDLMDAILEYDDCYIPEDTLALQPSLSPAHMYFVDCMEMMQLSTKR